MRLKHRGLLLWPENLENAGMHQLLVAPKNLLRVWGIHGCHQLVTACHTFKAASNGPLHPIIEFSTGEAHVWLLSLLSGTQRRQEQQ